MPKKEYLKNGFTLIEIIVTITIIAVVTAIAANGFNRSNSGASVISQVEITTSDLRGIGFSALNSEQFQLQSTSSWGLYLEGDENRYTIFADIDGDGSYDSNEKFKTVDFNPNLFICLDWNSQCQTTGTVIFTNVTAVPYIDGAIIDATDLGVLITDNVSSVSKEIFINHFGTVSHN